MCDFVVEGLGYVLEVVVDVECWNIEVEYGWVEFWCFFFVY